jgi:predicted nucleic acid-binding protein
MSKEYLIDSNVIVYSINSQSIYNQKCQEIFKRIIKGDIKGVMAQQNILESYRVLTNEKYANPMPPKEALAYLGEYELLCRLISPDLTVLNITKDFIRKFKLKSHQVYDAYLAATMKLNDVTGIVTANEKDFAMFKEFEILNPLS